MDNVLGSLIYNLKVDTKGFSSDLKGAEKQASSSGEHIEGALSKVGGVLSGLAVGGFAIQGLSELKDGIEGLIEPALHAQQVATQTAQVIKSTGDASGLTAKQIEDYGLALSKTTPYSHDAIQSAENLLLTFTNIKGNTFPQTTQAVLDMSAAFKASGKNMDISDIAIQVGKALNDPIKGMTALRRVGVSFSQSQIDVVKQMVATGDTAGAQKIILAELTKEFGGSAVAAGTTLAGSLTILSNQFDLVKENVGTAVIPILSQLLAAVTPLVTTFADDLPGALDALQTRVAPPFAYMTTVLAGVEIYVKELATDFGILGQAVGSKLLSDGVSTLEYLAYHVLPPMAKFMGELAGSAQSANGPMSRLGISSDDLATAVTRVVEAFVAWKLATAGFDAVMTPIRGVASTVKTVQTAWENVSTKIGVAKQEQGDLCAAADECNKTQQSDLDKVAGKWQTIISKLDTVKGKLSGLTGTGEAAAQGAAPGSGLTADAEKLGSSAASGIASSLAGKLPAAIAGAGIAEAITLGLGPILGTVGAAMGTTLTAAIGLGATIGVPLLIVAVVAAAGLLIYHFRQPIEDFFTSTLPQFLLQTVPNAFGSAVDAAGSFLTSHWQVIVGGFLSVLFPPALIVVAFLAFQSQIESGLSSVLSTLQTFFTTTVPGVLAQLPYWIGYYGTLGIAYALVFAVNVVTTLVTGLAGVLTAIVNGFGAGLSWLATNVPTWPGLIVGYLSSLGSDVLGVFTGAGQSIISGLSVGWTWVSTTVPTWPGDIVGFLSSLGGLLLSLATGAGQAIINGLTVAWTWASTTIPTWPGLIIGFLSSLPALALNIATLGGQALITGITVGWTWASTTIPTWPGAIAGFLTSLPGLLGKEASDAGQAVITGLTSAIDWADKEIPTWPDKIKGFLGDLEGDMAGLAGSAVAAFERPWEDLAGVMASAINAVLSPINSFIKGVDDALAKVGSSWSIPTIPLIHGGGGATGGIHGFAAGGITPGGPIIAGERGQELLMPPAGTHVFNAAETIAIFKAINGSGPQGAPLDAQGRPLGRGAGILDSVTSGISGAVSGATSAVEGAFSSVLSAGVDALLSPLKAFSVPGSGIAPEIGRAALSHLETSAETLIKTAFDKLASLFGGGGGGNYPGGNAIIDRALITQGAYLWCEKFVGDVLHSLGAKYSGQATAEAHAHLQPLNAGLGPTGAVVFFPWESEGHVAFSGGNGQIFGTLNTASGTGWSTPGGWTPYGWTTNPYANGGIISEPVVGVGQKSGQGYLFGEKGNELVTPMGRGGGPGGAGAGPAPATSAAPSSGSLAGAANDLTTGVNSINAFLGILNQLQGLGKTLIGKLTDLGKTFGSDVLASTQSASSAVSSATSAFGNLLSFVDTFNKSDVAQTDDLILPSDWVIGQLKFVGEEMITKLDEMVPVYGTDFLDSTSSASNAVQAATSAFGSLISFIDTFNKSDIAQHDDLVLPSDWVIGQAKALGEQMILKLDEMVPVWGADLLDSTQSASQAVQSATSAFTSLFGFIGDFMKAPMQYEDLSLPSDWLLDQAVSLGSTLVDKLGMVAQKWGPDLLAGASTASSAVQAGIQAVSSVLTFAQNVAALTTPIDPTKIEGVGQTLVTIGDDLLTSIDTAASTINADLTNDTTFSQTLGTVFSTLNGAVTAVLAAGDEKLTAAIPIAKTVGPKLVAFGVALLQSIDQAAGTITIDATSDTAFSTAMSGVLGTVTNAVSAVNSLATDGLAAGITAATQLGPKLIGFMTVLLSGIASAASKMSKPALDAATQFTTTLDPVLKAMSDVQTAVLAMTQTPLLTNVDEARLIGNVTTIIDALGQMRDLAKTGDQNATDFDNLMKSAAAAAQDGLGVFAQPATTAAAASAGPAVAMAAGGVITEPVSGLGLNTGTRYLFGEKGPEAVVPMAGTRGAGGTGSGRAQTYNPVPAAVTQAAIAAQQAATSAYVQQQSNAAYAALVKAGAIDPTTGQTGPFYETAFWALPKSEQYGYMLATSGNNLPPAQRAMLQLQLMLLQPGPLLSPQQSAALTQRVQSRAVLSIERALVNAQTRRIYGYAAGGLLHEPVVLNGGGGISAVVPLSRTRQLAGSLFDGSSSGGSSKVNGGSSIQVSTTDQINLDGAVLARSLNRHLFNESRKQPGRG